MNTKEIKRRKSRWSLHCFTQGSFKTFNAIDMPKFRTALSLWNKNNPTDKIEYDYVQNGNKITVTRK